MKLATIWYRTAFVLLLVGLIGLAGVWQVSGWSAAMAFDGVSQEVPTDGNGEIHGRITGDTGNPIAGVRVMLSLASNNSYLGATDTDANGVYTFANLPLTTYKICTSATSSASSQYFHRCLDTQIVLSEADPIQQNVDVVLLSGAHISGRVTNEFGEPIKDIEVRIYFQLPGQVGQTVWEPFNSINSDADGNYTLQRITAGTYRLCALSNRRYIGECYNDAATVDNSQDITIADNQYLTGYDFQLALGGSILGSVTYNDGQFVPWGQINTYIASQASTGATFWELVGEPHYVQESGLYTITGLATGTYRLQLENPYPEELPFIGEYYKDVISLETATDIPVEVRQTVSNINFQVARRGMIYGTVTNDAGQPLGQVNIIAESVQPGTSAYHGWGITDASGNYTMTFDAPTTFRLKFYQDVQTGEYATEYYDNSATAEGATLISIEPDKVIGGINAQLSRRGAIVGSIFNTKGEPISQITMHLLKPVGCCQDVYTWDKSTFEFINLESGVYHLCAYDSTPPNEYTEECYLDSPSIESSADILVQPATVTTVNFVLKRFGSLVGTVTSPYGTPIEMADVRLWQKTSVGFFEYRQAFTNSKGYYSFDLLQSGTYYVGVPFVNGGTNFLVEYYDNKPTVESSTPVSVTLEQTKIVDFELTFNPNINAPPYARNDAIWVSQVATSTRFTSGALSILTNDQDFEHAPLTITLTVSPTHGTLQLAASGAFTYTHDSSKTVFDSFTYHVNDGNSDSNSATVSIILPDAKNLFLPLVER